MKVSVTLVGTRGRMGALFHNAWSGNRPVRAVNRTRDAAGNAAFREEDLASGIPGSDVVILCVPAPAMAATLDAVVPHLRAGQILADVCSVKIRPMGWMEERFAGPVVGTHPLFGPENGLASGRVALVRGKRATDADMDRVGSLFRDMGCVTAETTAEEHDKAVAVTQSLHFALAAAYFATAADNSSLRNFITPSFERFLEAARSELTAGAPMFAEFTAANPLFPEILEECLEKLRRAGPGNLAALAAEAGAWFR